MEEDRDAFAQRYRRWIDEQEPDRRRVQDVWQKIAHALELGQGPPPRWPPGKQP